MSKTIVSSGTPVLSTLKDKLSPLHQFAKQIHISYQTRLTWLEVITCFACRRSLIQFLELSDYKMISKYLCERLWKDSAS